MAKKNSLKEVPFQEDWKWTAPDVNGNQERIPLGWHMTAYPETYGERIQWRPNEPFEATLELDHLERGRSAARFWFKDTKEGTLYPVFGQSLVELIHGGDMVKGVTSGTWIAVKRGANYGIERYEA